MTDLRVGQIRAWAAEGKTLAWVGAQFGISKQRVQQIAVANDVHCRGLDWTPELRAKASQQMREKHNAGVFDEAKTKLRHPDYANRAEQIRLAAAEGLTFSQTAERLGMTRSGVAGFAKRQKVSFKKEPK